MTNSDETATATAAAAITATDALAVVRDVEEDSAEMTKPAGSVVVAAAAAAAAATTTTSASLFSGSDNMREENNNTNNKEEDDDGDAYDEVLLAGTSAVWGGPGNDNNNDDNDDENGNDNNHDDDDNINKKQQQQQQHSVRFAPTVTVMRNSMEEGSANSRDHRHVVETVEDDHSMNFSEDHDHPHEGATTCKPAEGWTFDMTTGMRTLKKQEVCCVSHRSAKSDESSRYGWTWFLQPSSRRFNRLSSRNEGSEGGGDNQQGGSDGNGNNEKKDEDVKVYRIKSKNNYGDEMVLVHTTFGSKFSFFISEYLRWTFRATFLEVTIMAYIQFCCLTFIFGLWIYAVGQYQPSCLQVGGATFSEAGTDFVDALHLSWTTFSSVGYGIVYPANASDKGRNRCIGINTLMAVESFVGVLFAAIIGSIVFGKVARIQSVAQVEFSYPMVVRYGSGVMVESSDDPANATDDNDEKEERIPCPVLEFRIINELTTTEGGEILDASVNVVAATNVEVDHMDELHFQKTRAAAESASANGSIVGRVAGGAASAVTGVAGGVASGGVKIAKKTLRTGAKLIGAGKHATAATGSMVQRLNHSLMSSVAGHHHHSHENSAARDMDPFKRIQEEEEANEKLEAKLETLFMEKMLEKRIMDKMTSQLESINSKKSHRHLNAHEAMRSSSVVVDEGNAELVPPQVYNKLEMETDSHPFFKRVWNLRHTLNKNSPLLSREARRRIEENGGFWPDEWNNHQSVREHLRFSEIIVNFSGTANVSGSSVFAVKVYNFSFVNVGYCFVSTLCRSDDGKLIADLELINDVQEQSGGGGEPFQNLVKMKNVLAAFSPSTFSSSKSKIQRKLPEEQREEVTKKAVAVFKNSLVAKHQNQQTPQHSEEETLVVPPGNLL